MPRVIIDRLDDPRIAIYRQLKRTNETRQGDQFVVKGEKLFERLLQSPFPLASVLSTDRLEAKILPKVPEDVPCYVVPHNLLSVVVGFNFHRGVLACGLRRPWPALGEIVGTVDRTSTVVVCPTINNPENLGTIVRISDVFGVDAVLVGKGCPDPLSRRVLRVSMGTSLHLPVIASDDLQVEVSELQSRLGFELMATVLDPSAEAFDQVHRPGRLALFMGSEGEGLEPEWVRRCPRHITIPMRPDAESLNVAVAAGILLYHFSGSREE